MSSTKKNFERTLLEIIGLVGEYPYKEIYLFGYTKNYMVKIIRKLKKEGVICIYYKDRLKGIRFTKEYINELKKQGGKLKGINSSYKNKSDKTKRIRVHKIAETMLLMYKSDIKIFGYEKPITDGDLLYKINQTKSSMFYSSVELKKGNADKFKVISSSRFIGILLTNKNQYIVYNCGNSLMKWSKYSEDKALLFFKYLEENNKYQDDTKQVMIVDNLEILSPLLNTVKTKPSKLGFRLDLSNEGFYCITKDLNGAFTLKLLCDTENYNKLVRTVTVGFTKINEYSKEFIDLDGKEVIICFLLDMVKLVKFTNSIEQKQSKGKIICFDFQKQAIKNYCGSSDIEIVTVDSKKVGEVIYGI